MALKTKNASQVISGLRDAQDEVVDLLTLDDRSMNYASEHKSTMANTIMIHQLPEVIRWHANDPGLRGMTLAIMGPSAIGKTEAIRAGLLSAASDQGRDLKLSEQHVSQMMVTDVAGVPRDDGMGRTVWYPPRAFALKSAHPEHVLALAQFDDKWKNQGIADWEIMENFPLYAYFWDEVTNPATPQTVHQCFSLWMGNQVAGHELVGDAMHILAGNRKIDGTNSIDLAKSATTRLSIIEALPSLGGWMTNFALRTFSLMNTKGEMEEYTHIHPTVISFLHQNSGRFAPVTVGLDPMLPHPSPRTWDFVSRIMYANDRNPLSEEILRAKIASHIGTGDTTQFWSFRNYWEKLPDVNRLLNSPEVPSNNGYGWLPAEWPKKSDVDIRMIIMTQMVAKLNEKNAPRFMKFMMDDTKMSPELAAAAIKMLKPLDKLKKLAYEWARDDFAEWSRRNANFIF
jgi:hypothetical protein